MNWKFKKEWICPRDSKSLSRYDHYRDYYKVKYSIAKNLNPKTILEIGVRAGYSAISFLSAAPEAQYIGLDAENGTHGNQGGPWCWWAKQILSPFDFEIIIQDTQKITSDYISNLGNFDLIHIDGDHSYKGAYHDITICLPSLSNNGIMLIDDYDFIPDVKKAVDRFVHNNSIEFDYLPSFRGEAILKYK